MENKQVISVEEITKELLEKFQKSKRPIITQSMLNEFIEKIRKEVINIIKNTDYLENISKQIEDGLNTYKMPEKYKTQVTEQITQKFIRKEINEMFEWFIFPIDYREKIKKLYRDKIMQEFTEEINKKDLLNKKTLETYIKLNTEYIQKQIMQKDTENIKNIIMLTIDNFNKKMIDFFQEKIEEIFNEREESFEFELKKTLKDLIFKTLKDDTILNIKYSITDIIEKEIKIFVKGTVSQLIYQNEDFKKTFQDILIKQLKEEMIRTKFDIAKEEQHSLFADIENTIKENYEKEISMLVKELQDIQSYIFNIKEFEKGIYQQQEEFYNIQHRIKNLESSINKILDYIERKETEELINNIETNKQKNRKGLLRKLFKKKVKK